MIKNLTDWMEQRSKKRALRLYFTYLISWKLDAELELAGIEYVAEYLSYESPFNKSGWMRIYRGLLNGNISLGIEWGSLPFSGNIMRSTAPDAWQQLQELPSKSEQRILEFYGSQMSVSKAVKDAEKQSCIWIAEQCITLCDHLVVQRALLLRAQAFIDDYNLTKFLANLEKVGNDVSDVASLKETAHFDESDLCSGPVNETHENAVNDYREALARVVTLAKTIMFEYVIAEGQYLLGHPILRAQVLEFAEEFYRSDVEEKMQYVSDLELEDISFIRQGFTDQADSIETMIASCLPEANSGDEEKPASHVEDDEHCALWSAKVDMYESSLLKIHEYAKDIALIPSYKQVAIFRYLVEAHADPDVYSMRVSLGAGMSIDALDERILEHQAMLRDAVGQWYGPYNDPDELEEDNDLDEFCDGELTYEECSDCPFESERRAGLVECLGNPDLCECGDMGGDETPAEDKEIEALLGEYLESLEQKVGDGKTLTDVYRAELETEFYIQANR